MAAAAFRGPSDQLGSSQAQSLVRVLQSCLPNLASVSRGRDSVTEDGTMAAPAVRRNSECDRTERTPGRASSTGTEERTAHALGLDCYSSSDEDCDT